MPDDRIAIPFDEFMANMREVLSHYSPDTVEHRTLRQAIAMLDKNRNQPQGRHIE